MFALFGLSPSDMLVLLISVLVTWLMWRICTRAGFPGALALLVIIPFGLIYLYFLFAVFSGYSLPRVPLVIIPLIIPSGLIVLLLVLAFAEWPALRRRPSQPGEVTEPGAPAGRPREMR